MTVKFARSLLSTVLLASATAASAADTQQNLSLITYGADAPTREGDFYHAQSIYISVPDTLKDRLWINIFDPGISGEFDQLMIRTADSKTRFAVFGGAGASKFNFDQTAATGTLISEKSFGTEPESLGQWRNIAIVDPRQGDSVAGRRVFRLAVQGIAGDAGNAFDVAVSDRENRRHTPQDLKIYSYQPTIRVRDPNGFAELRFTTPKDGDRLTIRNFDAANGRVDFTTNFKSRAVKSSGQDEWQQEEVHLSDDQRDSVAAINFSRGSEMPNDATFVIADARGEPVRIELPVRIWPDLKRPQPVVTQTALSSCGSVSFDARRSSDPKSGSDLQYIWHFGDGGTSEDPVVRHDYRAHGPFRGRLEVYGSSGQIGNSAALDFNVAIKAPPRARINMPPKAAAGAAINFSSSNSAAGDLPIRIESWRFNDGVELTGEAVSRKFDKPGRYSVSLIVDDGSGQPCNSSTAEASIIINAAPVAVAGNDHHVSVGDAISFDASQSFDPDGKIASYHWTLGDGTVSEQTVVSHAYREPGTYVAKLFVTDDAALENSTNSVTKTIVVNAPPIAVAGKDISAAIGQPLMFDASGSRDPDGHLVAWNWDFGDGDHGMGVKAPYAFPIAGTYQVKLRVKDDSGTSSDSAESTLVVKVNNPPVASAGPSQLVTASVVDFDGGASTDSDGKIELYHWDFGDGASGTGQRPSHVYSATGSYKVQLVITDDSGTERNTSKATTNVVVNARPIADPGPARIVSPGEKVIFDASRSLDPDGDVAKYHWEFRDGAEGNGRIVSHSFEKPGVYPVRLTIADDTGQSGADDSKETRITVNAPPVADAGGDLILAPGDAAHLSAANSYDPDGQIATARWDLSDGSEPMAGSDITHKFDRPGVYTARLTVTDNSGAANGSDSRQITIAVNNAPTANPGADVITESSIVSFDATGSIDPDGDALTYRWDFGDGNIATGAQAQHTYVIGGTYPVILTVDDGKALPNSTGRAVKSVIIHKAPVADAGGNREVCTGDIITFDGSKSRDQQGGSLRYVWDFGDNTQSSIVNPTKSYRKAGNYPVTLKVQDASNLPNNFHSSRISVKVDQGPIADAGPDIEACAMTPVDFDAAKSFDPNGTLKRFDWDFGDGGFAAGERPSHIYERPGQYRVFLKVEGQAAGHCDPYSTDEMTVRILPGPVAQIDAAKVAPLGDDIVFDGSKSAMTGGTIKNWKWTFDDGQTAEGAVVKHRFSTPGRKTVTLHLVTNSASPTCTEVKTTHVLDINSPPVANITMPESAAVGDELALDAGASTDPDGAIATYAWSFGDGETATGVSVRHRFKNAGSYRVQLTVDDGAGVANSSVMTEKEINVSAPVATKIDLPDSACVGEDVHLSVSGVPATVKPVDANWQSVGDASDQRMFTRRFDRPGNYDVTVLTDDGKGLANSRKPETRVLHINRPPMAIPGPRQMVCPNDLVTFDGTKSYDPDGKITRFQWDFGDGTKSDQAKATHRFAAPGSYGVKLTVSDDTGSSCSATTTTTQVIVNAPPVAEASQLFEAYIGGAADDALLDGSASRDPDGQALNYTWQIGDGTVESGERTRHYFRKAGDIPVTLTVTDMSGLSCGTDVQTMVVKVRSRSPPD